MGQQYRIGIPPALPGFPALRWTPVAIFLSPLAGPRNLDLPIGLVAQAPRSGYATSTPTWTGPRLARVPRPTARITHTAKLEFSSEDRSENREAGHDSV
jgi:hypothetical protein